MYIKLDEEVLDSPVKLVPQSEMKDISERSNSNNANRSARLLTQEHVTGKTPNKSKNMIDIVKEAQTKVTASN
jgi:hypothetical protein